MWRVNEKLLKSKTSFPSMYQIFTAGIFMVFMKKFSKSLELYHLVPGLCPRITGIVEATNTLNRETHKHKKNCITVEGSRGTQKLETFLENDASGFAFFSLDLRHLSGSKVGIEFEVMLRRNGTHLQNFADVFARRCFFMIYGDLIEHNIGGDKKAPLLHYFLFISKLKARNIKTTGLYMNYQTVGSLQFRPLLLISFHSFHNDLRDTSG